MKKYASIACCLLLATGCATRGEMEDIEDSTSTSQKILRENEQRLSSLENSVSALNSQIAQLNNRVYEVRTRTGQKTAMKVVPVSQGQTQSASVSTPSAPQPAPRAPAGKKINPASRPAPLANGQQAKKVATPRPQPATPVAAASGKIGQPEPAATEITRTPEAQQPEELSLPPTDVPVPQNNSNVTAIMAPANSSLTPLQTAESHTPVPVPLIPASDLSLPPEHPDLPPVAAPAEAPVQTPAAKAPAPQSQAAPKITKGEEAAYKAALNAVRSGKTNEGIRLFREFLQKYPNGRYAANADFWIGESLYSQGKYKEALDQYQAVNNTFPAHHKNADALLKAAMTMSKMGDQAGASAKYQQLISSFPNSDAARRAKAMGYGR